MNRLIAFWSPTGAGASTLLLNTAAVLGARSNRRVAAADLNLVAPSLALATDLVPHDLPDAACLSQLLPLLEGGRLTPDDVAGRLKYAYGFAVLPGVLDVVAATRMTEAYVDQLLRYLGAQFDCVLVDLTRALDSVACLPVLQMADRVVLAVAPDLASRFHTRRYVGVVRALELDPKLVGVLNRATGSANPEHVARDIDLPIAVAVPEVSLMPALTEGGRLAVEARQPHPALGRFRSAVEQLAELFTPG